MANRILIDKVYSGTHDGRTFLIEAHTAEGQRYHLIQEVEGEGVADRLVARIEAAGIINLDFWNRGYPVYGSDAFVSEERQAARWAQGIREGHCSLDDVPSSLKTLL